MKKIISLILAAMLVLATSAMLNSCGDNTDDGGDTTTTANDTTAGDTTADTTGATVTDPATEENDETLAGDIDLQPKMDISTVSGTPGANETEGPTNIFDGDSSTKWCALQEGVSVEWKMIEPVTVNYYYFTTANDAPERNPASWVFYGSVDGANWVELDKVEGATLPTDFFTDSEKFEIENPQTFEYYKLEITEVAVPGTEVTQFSEFNFYQTVEK
jgi:hypothetical protein